MPRPVPSPAPQLSLLEGRADRPLLDIEISVVTPLFGGSATPGAVDPAQPIRAASVRGHLRFWWRACHGGRYGDVNELFDAEAKLWGSTEQPSAVTVQIEILAPGTEISCAAPSQDKQGRLILKPQPHYPNYALFPFQGKVARGVIEQWPAKALEGVRFRLWIGATRDALQPEQQEQVRGAVWAWLTFGGIGARTRRGCGSLYCADAHFAPSGDPRAWLRQQARRYVQANSDAAAGTLAIPCLSGSRLLLGSRTTIAKGWVDAVDVMQTFRQVDVGRPEGRPVPGRSRWPEADSLRRAFGAARANTPIAYPRADLGLPIVFHFKRGARTPEPAGSLILEADEPEATRMASPIILKALAVSDTHAVPLVICLNVPHVGQAVTHDLRLRQVDDRGREMARHQISRAAVAHTATPPLTRFGAADARSGLLRYAANKWDAREELL